MTFGRLVKVTRQSRGWTQEELAHRAFVSLRAVQSWEQQWRLPKLPTIPKVAKALRLPVHQLSQLVTLSAYKRVV